LYYKIPDVFTDILPSAQHVEIFVLEMKLAKRDLVMLKILPGVLRH
jgi:hypothetical protein